MILIVSGLEGIHYCCGYLIAAIPLKHNRLIMGRIHNMDRSIGAVIRARNLKGAGVSIGQQVGKLQNITSGEVLDDIRSRLRPLAGIRKVPLKSVRPALTVHDVISSAANQRIVATQRLASNKPGSVIGMDIVIYRRVIN